MVRKRNWSSLLASAKRVGMLAGVGTAIIGFVLQGYALLQISRSRAAAEQHTADRLGTVEDVVKEIKVDVKGLAASVNEMKGRLDAPTPTESTRRLVGPVQRINP